MRRLCSVIASMLFVGLVVSQATADYKPPGSTGYTFAGTGPGGTSTKWEPGANTAVFLNNAPNYPTPGGATFSIMGAGLGQAVAGHDTSHGTSLTQAITDLGVGTWGVADYVALIDWALDQWAAVSAFTNLGHVADSGAAAGATQANNGHLGDIRVAAWSITAATTLAHAFQPGVHGMFSNSTIAGDVHFDVGDANHQWVDDASDTNPMNDTTFDIYTVALHEIGHALGLGHSTDANSVMFADYSGARRTLTADDIAGIRALYGVPEPGAIVGLFSLASFGFGVIVVRRRQSKRVAA